MNASLTIRKTKAYGSATSKIESNDIDELRHIGGLMAEDRERYASVVLVYYQAAPIEDRLR